MKYENLVNICNSIKSCPNLNKYSDANFDSFREKFLNLFYWTHYQKCFPGINDKGAHKQPKTKCAPEYLEKEIRAAEPEYIIAMGSNAVKFITKNNLKGAINRNRNSPFLFDGKIPIISITHPSDANNGAKRNEKEYKYEDSIILIKEIVSKYI